MNWNLGQIFKDENDPLIEETRKKVEEVSGRFISKWSTREDYLSDPAVLKEALDEHEDWFKKYGLYDSEVFYFSLRNNLNQTDPVIKGRLNQIMEKAKKLLNDSQFFTLRIAKIPEDKQKDFLENENLREYKHFLERQFVTAKYQLSEAEEKIMILKSASSHENWVKMVSSFIAKEESKGKSFDELLSDLSSKEVLTRETAGKAVNKILGKYTEVAENEMNAILGDKKVNDDLRKLPKPESARLVSDDIDEEVVGAMVDSVSARFDISKRWYEFKAKLLGLPKLKYYERVVDYGNLEAKITFEESMAMVKKVFSKLDPEFEEIFDKFLKDGNLDEKSAKGKSGGAFCISASLNLPTYILMNHTGRFWDMTTLAHELGHGINAELMKKSQNALNFDTPMSTAEVASTFMEDFVLSEYLEGADEETRLSIMVKRMDDEVSTIFRQVAAYLFERELHKLYREKGYLGKEEIGKLFLKHMGAYMGSAVEMTKGSENWWVYWSHLRRFFYVYSYASGLLISKSLQASVRKDPKFILKVKDFLAAGTSDSPKNIFNNLGVDITDKDFWNRGVLETKKLLNEIEDLAKKLGKI